MRSIGPADGRSHWPQARPWWSGGALLVAVALAAVTRIAAVNLVEFKFDEVWALEVATAIREGRALPAVGIGSSLDIPNPPFFPYLLVLPLLVSPAPEGATAFIGLLNLGAILVTAWLARSLLGARLAAVAVLLYAVLPWAVLFSRKVWAQDAMPLFLVVAVACLWTALSQERPWLLVPSVALLALASELHLTALALAPLWVMALLVPGRRRTRLLSGALGSALAVAFYLPYLYWQAAHGWPVVNRPSPGFGGGWSGHSFAMLAETVAGQPYSVAANLGDSRWLADGWDAALRPLLIAALLLGMLRLLDLARRDPARRWRALFILGWLALPALAFVRPTVPIYPHYFITGLPAAAMAMAMGLSPAGGTSAITRASHVLGWTSDALVALIVLSGGALFAAFIAAIGDGRATASYGPPLASRYQAVSLVRDVQAETAEPLFVAGNHEERRVYRYLLATTGRAAAFVDDRQLLALPTASTALYLLTDDTAPISDLLRDRFGATTLAEFRPTAEPRMVRLVRVSADALPQVLNRSEVLRDEYAFANGLTLVASEVGLAGSADAPRVHILLYWSVHPEATGPEPRVFNHLHSTDGADRLIAQADGPSFVPSEWPSDVVLLTPFAVAVPPSASGSALVRTGLYYLDTMQRVRLVDGGDSVESRRIELGKGPRP
ncbi:MAG: hypothetical protein HYY04_07590 [Chloroflexi bacterium]|nr:hypothetical protein [Chloroflexota bacterium]